jgi:hypothetical protein
VTALLPRIVKKELSTQSALAIWCSRSSDTTHCPIFLRLACEYLRADRHVGLEFALSGQAGDLEPELLVDSCLHGGLGVADDAAQVAQAGDEGADVVFGEMADDRVTVLAGVAGERGAALGLDLAGPFGDGLRVGSSVEGGLVAASRASQPAIRAWVSSAGGASLAVPGPGPGLLASRGWPAPAGAA